LVALTPVFTLYGRFRPYNMIQTVLKTLIRQVKTTQQMTGGISAPADRGVKSQEAQRL